MRQKKPPYNSCICSAEDSFFFFVVTQFNNGFFLGHILHTHLMATLLHLLTCYHLFLRLTYRSHIVDKIGPVNEFHIYSLKTDTHICANCDDELIHAFFVMQR